VKGLVLAGGWGTRLRPLTFSGNKHMIPVANRPILFYGLADLRAAGILDVGVVLGPVREGIEERVGDGSAFGLRVTYVEQGPPKGIAHAILIARDFLGDEPFLLYLGDNLLEGGVQPFVDRFARGDASAVVGAVAVADPSRYGVVELGGDGRIRSLEEKPKAPRSDLALVGVYLFGPAVHDVVRQLRPSARDELEITDAIRELDRRTGTVRVLKVAGWWKDTGRPEDILDANRRVLESRPPSFFEVRGRIDPGARVTGSVAVGAGSRVEAGAELRGPLVLGENVTVGDGATLGPFTSVGDGGCVRRATVERSVLLENVAIEAPVRIADSIIGRGTRIEANADGDRPRSFLLGDASRVTL
jgi:glucose-1-phosphate thymidylyltransferase